MPERVRAALTRVLLVVALFVAGGAVAGVVWEWLWTPPTGVVVEHQYLRDGEALRSDFSGTALYVLVSATAGLLLGVLVAVRTTRSELVTMAAVVVGSVLAAWVTLQVGTAVDPPDPGPIAAESEDLTELPDDLEVVGKSPYVAFPSGALVGLIVVFVGLSGRRGADD